MADDDSSFRNISIHTPARGVTCMPIARTFGLHDFNPHSRKGSDSRKGTAPIPVNISIHTPARGVTGLTIQTLAG